MRWLTKSGDMAPPPTRQKLAGMLPGGRLHRVCPIENEHAAVCVADTPVRMGAPFDRSETDAVTLGGLVDYYEMLGVKVRAGAGEVGGA